MGLKRVLKICTICITCNIVVIPFVIEAQEVIDTTDIKLYDIGDVIITVSNSKIEEQKASPAITIIPRAEITRSPAQSINDLLRYIAGVDIRQRGPVGVQADISLRGGTFDQTLILLNGINISDPQTGHHNLNLPTDIESIERIEVLRGAAAKSYGANAFNGAINIITGNTQKNHIRASASYGQFGLYKASVNVSNTFGKYRHFFSATNAGSDGYISNTEFTSTNLFYQGSYQSSIGSFDFQTGYNKKEFAANSFYSLRFPNQFEATKTEFASLKYQSHTKIKISAALYFRRQRDRFELRRDTLPFNHHLTNIAGINLGAVSINRIGKTTAGIDFRNEHIISNILGITLNPPVGVPGFNDVKYINYFNRANISIYADHTFTLNKFTIIAGANAYHNNQLRGLKLYPGIDLSYRLGDHLNITSSVNKTMRSPTFTDMFYKNPSQKGNLRLVPEEAVTFESGLKYDRSHVQTNLNLFRRLGYKIIDWVKDPSPDSLIWRSMNHSQINFTGVEYSLSFVPAEGSKFERIQLLNVSYSYLQAGKNSDNMLSRYALDYLKHQITTSIDIRILWKLFVSNRLTYNDRNGSYQDKKGNLVQYKPFWLDDARVYWKSEYYTLLVEGSNIFNSAYYDFGGIIQPGRWLRAGVVVDLDYIK